MIDKKSLTDWSIGGRGRVSACIATLYEKISDPTVYPRPATGLNRQVAIYGPLNYLFICLLFAFICKLRGLTLVARCFTHCRREDYLHASG